MIIRRSLVRHGKGFRFALRTSSLRCRVLRKVISADVGSWVRNFSVPAQDDELGTFLTALQYEEDRGFGNSQARNSFVLDREKRLRA